MANLTIQVDQTTGNYEQVFVYSINASFNGIQDAIESASIKLFFPTYLELILGDAQFPVKEVIQAPVEGGTEVTYLFDSITDLGVVVRLGIGVLFNTDALNGQSYTCVPKLYINDALYLESQSTPIQLILTPQFELSRELVLPAIEPAPGGAIIYKVVLQNFGDLGSTIENVEITCSGSPLLLLDSTFTVTGNDTSSKFTDTSMDGTTGIFEENQFTLFLSSYSGERFEFYYRGVIDASLEIGEQLSTTANWSIDSLPQTDDISEFTIIAPTYQATLGIYGPDYSLPNEYLCYRLSVHNTGNQGLSNAVFENKLPNDVKYYQFQTGSFYIGAINQNLSAQYFIDYETQNGQSGTLGPYNTDSNTTVDLESIIDSSDNLSTLRWNLNSLGIGTKNRATPQLLGIVKSGSNGALQNHIHLTYLVNGTTLESVENFSTLLVDYCVLRPSLSANIGIMPVKPSDTIRYTLSFNCRSSRLENPIIGFILPDKLEYMGNETYDYNNFFPTVTPLDPPVKLLQNFDGEGSTFVKFEFKDEYAYSFHQLYRFAISFDAKVKIGSLGTFKVFTLLNTLDSTGIIPNAVDIYTDTYNIAEDSTVSAQYAKSTTIETDILFFVATSSNKKVKGMLDIDFIEEPEVGHTYSGGNLQYLIAIKNIGNAVLESVEIVDILPYIGDTGVIETDSPRRSEYPIYALSDVVAFVEPSTSSTSLEIYYSTSKDPLRFGNNFNLIGTDNDWTLEPPEDLSTLQAFKLKTTDLLLHPNETIKVTVMASTPIGVPLSSVAWNSFAANVIYRDMNNVSQPLLAIEPEKAGIEIAAPSSDTVSISGYSWFDTNLDGLYQEEESFINDIGVVLYDAKGQLLQYTFTRTDVSGVLGKYSFNNLEPGVYYIQFFVDQTKIKFTRQRTSNENGSKGNTKTGKTELLDLTVGNSVANIHIGVIGKNDFTLDEILAANRQARSMVRNVIHNQMLLTMKQEDVLDLIKE